MKQDSRTKNAGRNIKWAILSKVMSIALPFAVRTILVYVLGTEYLGLNSLLVSLLQVLNLAELGFGSAVVFSMYKPVAHNDSKLLICLLRFYKRVYRIIGAVILLLGIIIMPFIDCLISGDAPSDVDIRLAFAIYLVNSVLSYWLFAYRQSLLNAYQRNDIQQKVFLTVQILQNTAQAAVLLIIPNFYLFSIMLLLGTTINNVITAIVTKRMYPELFSKDVSEPLGPDYKKEIGKRVAGLMVQKICAVTRDSVDSVIISAFLGLSVVGLYSNYFVIVSGILGVLETVGPALTATVGNSIVLESVEKNFKDLRRLMLLYAAISWIAVACLLSVFQPFMELWMGQERLLDFSIPALLCMYFYVRTMGDILSIYADGIGAWWHLKWRAVLEAGINLLLDIVFVQLIGLQGAILATILSLLFINFGYGSFLVFSIYFGRRRVSTYYSDHIKYAVSGFAVATVTLFVTSLVSGSGVIALLMKVALALIISVCLSCAVFRASGQYSEACLLIKAVIKKRK